MRPQRPFKTGFSNDERGTTGLAFGLTAIPMFVMIGIAIDTGRVFSARLEMQAAADAASLAAARMPGAPLQSRIDAAVKTYQTNMDPASPASVAVPLVEIGAGYVTVTARTTVDYSATRALQLITGTAVEAATLDVRSKVSTAGKTLEVAMMLDVTGSMEQTSAGGTTKISDLKVAAKDLIDIVLPFGGSTSPTRISVVPFSSKVNVGAIAPAVTGLAPIYGSNQLVSCATERQGTQRFTDAAPTSGQRVGVTSPGSGTSAQYSATGACRVQHSSGSLVTLPEVKPLTSNREAIKSHIDSMATAGGTAGHLGTAWAWYTLSPNWNDVWSGADNDARAYDISRGPEQTNIKAAILMTDGEYNTDYSSGYTSAQMAAEMCTRMKAEGILIYTIGFDIDNDAARDMLRNCASPDPADPSKRNVFLSYSREALVDAFRAIGQSLADAAGGARLSE